MEKYVYHLPKIIMKRDPELNQNKYRIVPRERKKTGLPPGSLVYTGQKTTEPTSISVIIYDENGFEEKKYSEKDDYLNFDATNKLVWINVNGLNHIEVIEKISKHFQLHPLISEDILNVYQVPKIDEYPENDVLYITLNEFYFEIGSLDHDQISIILGNNFVLSFQEEEGDYFGILRERLRNGKGNIRKRGPDYLVYALIDGVLDSYYEIVDRYSDELEKIENDIFKYKNKSHLHRIHHVNKALIYLRRTINPLKEMCFKLLKEEMILVGETTKPFLKDLQDHVNQIVSQIDVDREYLSDLIQTNSANMNSHLNEIIKVLTLVSSIFIPLTFIVGVYGMNFDNLPELHSQNGYYFVWGIMITIAIVQFIIFKIKKWL